MRHFLAFLFSFFLMVDQCFAFQAPVSNMQNSVSGVIQSKLAARGINTSDPRFSQTIVGGTSAVLGAAVAGGASAGTLAGATWATVAVGAVMGGAIALTGVAIALAVGGAYSWLFKNDGTIQMGANPASINTPAGMPPPTVLYCYSYTCAASPAVACIGQGSLPNREINGIIFSQSYEWTGTGCGYRRTALNAVGSYVTEGTLPGVIRNNVTFCPGTGVGSNGLNASGGKCPASNLVEPALPPVKSPGDAVADVPELERIKPLNPLIVADIADAMWRQAAAAPGYAGIPYDATNPITAADATAYQNANPSTWPTVGDFISPQTAPSGSPPGSPFVLPTSPTPVTEQDPTTTPKTGTNPSTEPLQNLGPDPGIGAPALEPIPTAQQILSPLLNLFPSLKNFVVPNHNATCPKWSVHLFDRDVPLQDHCPMLEQVRPTAYATMAAVWILIALFIVLAA